MPEQEAGLVPEQTLDRAEFAHAVSPETTAMVLLLAGCAKLGKESGKPRGTLGRANPRSHLEAMIEPRVRADVEQAMHGAGLGIARAVDQTGDARIDQRTSAHRARFERDVDRGALQ